MSTFSLRLLAIFSVLFLLPIRLSQAETLQLTLEDAIQIALDNNPQIEIARQQYQANQGVLTQAKSFYLPQLSAGLGYGRQYIDNDLPVTDHCPGYPSAARFVAMAVMGDNLDNKSLPGVKIDIIMGRHPGWLTAASMLARQAPDDGPHPLASAAACCAPASAHPGGVPACPSDG